MGLNKSQYIKRVFYTFIVFMIIYGILRVNIETFRKLCAEENAENSEMSAEVVNDENTNMEINYED